MPMLRWTLSLPRANIQTVMVAFNILLLLFFGRPLTQDVCQIVLGWQQIYKRGITYIVYSMKMMDWWTDNLLQTVTKAKWY